ncbi:TetR/AcrR family transcriptional regulator [Streptomyces lydicus]|uniref:Regulator n=1 Tax=Streptomyces lydicus TaxID=47763 RepID=A0A1D7VPZ9_9ACTN|nr:TetR/AcrR family transcriptional regulator C-terminal domain-containing protein [Streptomyces lydicus]AOP48797.1 regulator [Streptomyces lydicus]
MAEEPVLVWDRPDRGARGPAPGRSRAQLARAAIRLADAGGLAAVSVRQVAGELGTGPASLYRYIAGRDDLLDLMTDAVTGEIDLTVAPTGDPVGDLVALSLRSREVHLRHPWLVEVPSEALRLGPRGLDHLEYALGALAPLALPGRSKLEAIAALSALVTMLCRAELQSHRSPTARQAAQAAYLGAAAGAGEHPLLTEALAGREATPPGDDAAAVFERVVHRALTGLLAPGPGTP